MKPLSDYVRSDLILFLNATSRNEVLHKLVDVLKQNNELLNPAAFYDAILEREKLVSTGIGMGVALPHAKVEICDKFFICLGLLSKGVDWDAIDHAPVRIVFMIGGPDDKQTEYLRILSSLTQFVKNEEIRKKLLTTNSKEAIMELFKN